MRYALLFVVACNCLLSCASVMTDNKIENALNSNQIRLGSTKEDVSDAGIEPAYHGCVKHKRTEEGLLELWDFSTDICTANTSNDYALVFRDGVLIEIRKVTSENDLNLDVINFPEN